MVVVACVRLSLLSLTYGLALLGYAWFSIAELWRALLSLLSYDVCCLASQAMMCAAQLAELHARQLCCQKLWYYVVVPFTPFKSLNVVKGLKRSKRNHHHQLKGCYVSPRTAVRRIDWLSPD